MGHRHLTRDHREILAHLLAQGLSIRSAARILGYSPSALSQELARGRKPDGRYCPGHAHRQAQRRRSRASRRGKDFSQALQDFVRKGLRLYWSPEQIAGRLKLDFPNDPTMRISFKTIYRWLRQAAEAKQPHPWGAFVRQLRLKRRGKRFGRGHQDRRGARSDLPCIETRPEAVVLRSRFGDWEGDLIRGHKGQGYLVTLVERSTGLLLAAPCADKRAETVNAATLQCFRSIGAKHVRSITVDRGKEFYGFAALEQQLGAKFYFCHPHSPHERGQNEQANGLLRQFFPKRKALSHVSQAEANRAVAFINNRPKKKFGYRTTMEVIEARGLLQVFSFA